MLFGFFVSVSFGIACLGVGVCARVEFFVFLLRSFSSSLSFEEARGAKAAEGFRSWGGVWCAFSLRFGVFGCPFFTVPLFSSLPSFPAKARERRLATASAERREDAEGSSGRTRECDLQERNMLKVCQRDGKAKR